MTSATVLAVRGSRRSPSARRRRLERTGELGSTSPGALDEAHRCRELCGRVPAPRLGCGRGDRSLVVGLPARSSHRDHPPSPTRALGSRPGHPWVPITWPPTSAPLVPSPPAPGRVPCRRPPLCTSTRQPVRPRRAAPIPASRPGRRRGRRLVAIAGELQPLGTTHVEARRALPAVAARCRCCLR